MKFVQIIATAALLATGVSAANASVFNDTAASLGDIQSAQSASVLTVTDNEALLLSYDNDVESIRARVQGNRWLLETIERQGFTIDQIVGVSGSENDLTLYAL